MWFLSLLLFLGIWDLPNDRAELRREVRSELSKIKEIYLERSQEHLTVITAGWEAKKFSINRSLTYLQVEPRLTQVVEIVSADPVPRKVLFANPTFSEVENSATVTSLGEIIGVEAMPDTFTVEFDDGTIWWVSSTDDWQGFHHLYHVQKLRWKLGFTLLWRFVKGETRETVFLTLEPELSRELFWMLQKDMKVIQ